VEPIIPPNPYPPANHHGIGLVPAPRVERMERNERIERINPMTECRVADREASRSIPRNGL